MIRYGLIGYPLTHSFSPAWFNALFQQNGIEARYDLFPMETAEGLRALVSGMPELQGLNVTIPHKEAVLPLLDELDPTAAAIGAVNCIDIREGVLTGFNTDYLGFLYSLQPLLEPHHRRALILGTGGAAKTVQFVLRELGVEWASVSRRAAPGGYTYADLTPEVLQEHTVIVNTTPVGMFPNVEAAPPLDYGAIGKAHLLYDLVYNPALTQFLALGAARGASVKNGQQMLELQAAAAWTIWRS